MERLVVVSNRVPVPSGGAQAGGLAVALDGLMDRRGGLWFGWSGKVSDDAARRDPAIEHHAGVEYATVDLSPDEHARYYNHFSNGVLWPLLHTMQQSMQYDRADARAYREVNHRLARALAPLLRPSDIVWVHDYHLLPMPQALRAAGVRNPIGLFLHVPFATTDVLGAAPEMGALVRDILGADLIGFQTENDLVNFINAAEQLAGCWRAQGNLVHVPGTGGGRRVRLGVFPVEIDAHAFADTARAAEGSATTDRLRRSLGGQTLLLGAERLDPTKGLLERVAGLRTLLEKRPAWRRHVTMVQIAASSRMDVGSYQALRADLVREAGSLNADLGDADWTPLRLVTRAVDRAVIAGYMRAARVGMVTPLRDGMNLVAKEFVAAQDPTDPGVLVLSPFAGAAQQLEAAVMVNPYDADAMAEAMDVGLTMRLAERQERWRALWGAIEDRSPLGWGRAFLATLLRAAATAQMPERVLRALEPARGRVAGDVPVAGRVFTPLRLGAPATDAGVMPLN